MKKYRKVIALSAFFLITYSIFGQTVELNSAERRVTTQRGMAVLGGWAVGNIAIGTALSFSTQEDTRYFHQMNAAWNLVNLSIAGVGLLTTGRNDASEDFISANEIQRRLESALLFNAGLDIGYMAAGWALLERSRRGLPDSARLSGFGSALILQGGFLFAFDLIVYLALRQSRPTIEFQ